MKNVYVPDKAGHTFGRRLGSDDMGKKKQSATVDAYATEAEIVQAITSLTGADSWQLEKFAGFRARALAGLGLSVDAEDLLHQAMERTLSGKRRWSRRVTFVEHLLGVIRSISSHAAKRLRSLPLVPMNPPPAEPDDEELTPWWELDSMMPDPERVALARIELEQINRTFANDDTISLIIDGLEAGMTGPEIQKDLQISATEYHSAMKQMRRVARRKAG